MNQAPPVIHSRDGHVRFCTITAGLPDLPPALRDAWQTWLDRMGIKARDVLLGDPISCDDQLCTISYTSFERRPDGRLLHVDGKFAHTVRVVQLEAPALPMPEEPAA